MRGGAIPRPRVESAATSNVSLDFVSVLFLVVIVMNIG